MGAKKKRAKFKLLSQGRPPNFKPVRSISSKATRTLIRSHHTLEKQKAKALAVGDDAKAEAFAKQIESQGGIELYQQASLVGQAADRGGDSSKILMEWLEPVHASLKDQVIKGQPIRLLEVGALSVMNACSKSRLFEIERIDLNSQAEGIKQEDFMARRLPLNEKEQFDIISLSLVLNYVPDAIGRGKMLLRTLEFLNNRQYADEGLQNLLPSLFLVLPAPCVMNSRYMDEGRLGAIMESLGYAKVKEKLSNKLVYYLWRMERQAQKSSFKKEEIRSGKSRNNFAVVLR